MSSGISFTCDSCGREVFGCNIVNGMKFCAKCYQETFGNQQKYIDMLNKESSELLVNSLAEKDKKIAELQKQLKEKEKKIEKLREGISQCEADRKCEQEKKNLAFKELRERSEQLKSQPAEIVEKIRKSIHYYPIALLDSDKEPRIKTLGISKEVLDTILEKYQK